MSERIRLPRNLADMQTHGAHLDAAERILNSLKDATFHAQLPDGTILKGKMNHSGNNSVVYLRPTGQGGAPVVSNNIAAAATPAPVPPPPPAAITPA